MNNILIHIPHSSYVIPDEYKDLFYLVDNELLQEQIKMSDSYTDELFDVEGIQKLIFPISRLVCDVERFRNEEDEEMSKQGMWVCYTKTSNCKPLKRVNNEHKLEILQKYYDKHHLNFEKQVSQMLKQGQCLIIDSHSFSSKPLPYELHAQTFRPDICVGTDNFHTPYKITNYFYNAFSDFGYKVGINNPFCGTIVPLKFYRKNKNVNSVMLEINRSLYMDEDKGKKNKNFARIKRNIEQVVSLCPFLT